MAVLLFERSNHALDVNPPAGHQHLSVHGSDWLWAVTAVFLLATVRCLPVQGIYIYIST